MLKYVKIVKVAKIAVVKKLTTLAYVGTIVFRKSLVLTDGSLSLNLVLLSRVKLTFWMYMICVNGTFWTSLITSVQLPCLLMCIMLLMYLILNMERLASYVLVQRMSFGTVLQYSLVIKVTFDFRRTVWVICHCVWVICKSAPRPRQIAMPVPSSLRFLQAGCPSCHLTNSVKALKAKHGSDKPTDRNPLTLSTPAD